MLYPVMRQHPWLASPLPKMGAREPRRERARPGAARRRSRPTIRSAASASSSTTTSIPALNRANVEVVDDRHRARHAETASCTTDGNDHALDAIVLATGFQTNPFLAPMQHRRRRRPHASRPTGRTALAPTTASRSRAIRTSSCSTGPNTNLGHNSIIFMLECQIAYVLNAIRALDEDDLTYSRPPARGDGRVQRAAPSATSRDTVVGRRRSELVQGRRGPHHQQLALLDLLVLVAHPPHRPRRIPRRSARRRRHRRRRPRARGGLATRQPTHQSNGTS